nr:flagellar basal body-associated FliL family protein [Gammaproteobacteria bacterium]
KGEAIYVDLHPAFTVNLQGKSKARFLQASVQVLTREPKVEQQIKQHAPMIRNKLVMLFSAKTSQELRTLEGKESLQNEARSAIENVLKAESGEGGVEAVFFTSFVMQ